MNAGSFEEAQRLLAQLGVSQAHVQVTTYFATRILYQRGKLDLAGVVARLQELLREYPDFPEARAMLEAAERGTLRPDPRGYAEATVPPPRPGADELPDEDSDRPTQPGSAPSTFPPLEARLKTPAAPGIPRAPLVPRFTPPKNPTPSYAPAPDLDLTPPGIDLDLLQPPSSRAGSDTLSAPPPSSTRTFRSDSPPAIAIDLGPLDGVPPANERNTAPSPGAPSAADAEPPSVFQIATWLAERDFERALSAVEKLGAESTPELSLLEVRALVGLGRKAAARRCLDRLCRAPLLDPDLRAAVARLLLELGDTDRAEAQARRAHAEDPGSELTCLTLAWTIARNDAWLPSPRSSEELSQLLRPLSPENCPLPALAFALRALTLLRGSPEAARQAADAALKLDPANQDALAVAAVIAQRQGRAADVQRFSRRLLDLEPRAADELRASLESLGQPAPSPDEVPPAAGPRGKAADSAAGARAQAEAAESSLWDPVEQRLATGDNRPALFAFEQGIARELEGVGPRPRGPELSTLAQLTARYLTEAPVSRHFAPYDFSLFSIARLDAALALLYRGSTGARTELRQRALLGLGAYTGECLRQAYAGEWLGDAQDALQLHVEGQGLCFQPFRDVDARLHAGRSLELGDAPLPHPGAEPLGQRVSLSLAPPAPWDPAEWPSVAELPQLGAQLRSSPVGLYCRSVELPLDLSFASLRGIDRYVTLLAPPLAPPDAEAPWVRRAAVLVGAYLGEVLRATRHGSWEASRGQGRAEAFRISLPGGTTALPIVAAFERLSGRRLEQPSDYARRVTA